MDAARGAASAPLQRWVLSRYFSTQWSPPRFRDSHLHGSDELFHCFGSRPSTGLLTAGLSLPRSVTVPGTRASSQRDIPVILEQVCKQQSGSFLLELTLPGAVLGTKWFLGILFILAVHEPVLWECFPTGQLTLNKPEARNIWHGTQPSTLSLLENVDIYLKKCFFWGGKEFRAA